MLIALGPVGAGMGVTSVILGDHGLFILAMIVALSAALVVGAYQNFAESKKESMNEKQI